MDIYLVGKKQQRGANRFNRRCQCVSRSGPLSVNLPVESTMGISEMYSKRECPRWVPAQLGVRYSVGLTLRVYPEIIRNPPLVQFWIRRLRASGLQ